MMYSKKAILLCLALVGLLGGVVAATQIRFSNDSTPDLREMLAQPTTAMQLRLYPAGNADPKSTEPLSALSSGLDINGADGKTKVLTHNEYVSGAVEDIHYRDDETKAWSRDYYPAPADGSPAVQRSVAWFSPDGKTYIGHEVKREDGRWLRHGELLSNGNYQQTYYCKDGTTVEKSQLFDKDKRFLSEQAIFCDTGKNVRSMTNGEYGKKILTLYNSNGKPTAVLSKQDNYETVNYAGDAYGENGEVTLHFNHDYGMHGSSSAYQIFKNGRTALEWQGYDAYSMNITVFDTSDDTKRARFRQTLKPKGYPFKDKDAVLQRVTEFGADGKTVARTIEFNEKRIPTSISMPGKDDSSTLIYTLDDAGKNVVKSVMHTTGQKEDQEMPLPAKTSVNFPEEFTSLYTHPDEPKWDDGSTDVGTRLYDFP